MRGQPDYGMYAVKEVSASISDMGEVAARLGSIVTYDKRGDVVDFDNFESPVLKWQTARSINTAYVRLDSESVRSLAQAVKLYTPATIGAAASITRSFSTLGSKRLGNEFSLSKLDASCLLYLNFLYADPDGARTAQLQISYADKTLSIVDADDNVIVIATYPAVTFNVMVFFSIKVVCDFTTNKYVRLLAGNYEYDISDYTIYCNPAAPSDFIVTSFYLENITGAVGCCWIDDWVFTREEP